MCYTERKFPVDSRTRWNGQATFLKTPENFFIQFIKLRFTQAALAVVETHDIERSRSEQFQRRVGFHKMAQVLRLFDILLNLAASSGCGIWWSICSFFGSGRETAGVLPSRQLQVLCRAKSIG